MRTGRPKARLELTPEERMQLQTLANSRSLPHSQVVRARIILAAANGDNNTAIARQIGLSQPSVGKWRSRFLAYRMAGLYDEVRAGRPRTVLDDHVASMLRKIVSTKPKQSTHWSVRLAAESSSVSKSTVHRLFRAFALQPHRTKSFKLSNDPFFVEKVRDICGLYLNPPDHALVLCVDEKSQIQALQRTQPVLPLGLGYVQGITHNYVRHGTTTLFAALNVANGEVLAQCKPRHRHQEFLAFLHHLEDNVPPSLDLHLIIDNYSTHKHAKVRIWLAQRPRFHVHYTPTYSSWLNQVERWFGLLTQRVLRRGSFSNVRELIRMIEQFVKNYNRTRHPFLWTATADSILGKLARLCERISGTVH